MYKNDRMTSGALDVARRFFAEEIRWAGNVQNEALVDAFATVPRERFLGPGPWDVAGIDPRRPGKMIYRRTPDANPRHLYHNHPVAIDAARELNNGHPSSLASWLDALQLRAGDRFVHLGCGVGYYTAIVATVVGPSGRVTAIELDQHLAERARANLADYPQVSVISSDGTTYRSAETFNAMFVNAGFTHPLPIWLESLSDDGRLLLPITATIPGTPIGSGWMLLVTRERQGFRALCLSPVAIFSSPTGRDSGVEQMLQRAFASGAWLRAKSLRVDAHERDDSCCVHVDGACLSSREPGTNA